MELSTVPSTILNTLNEVPPEAWTIIVEVVVGALVVSPALVGLKKWWDINSAKVMTFWTIVASLLAGAGAYLHNDPRYAPWFILVQGWLILATTQPVYRYAVKPLFTRLGIWFASKLALANQINQSKADLKPSPASPTDDARSASISNSRR